MPQLFKKIYKIHLNATAVLLFLLISIIGLYSELPTLSKCHAYLLMRSEAVRSGQNAIHNLELLQLYTIAKD